MEIAVLLATFNRKEKTLSCLRSLFDQKLEENVNIYVFLTDDASSDGTVEAISTEFPSVTILKGNGSLFWAGGMRYSWTTAVATDPDYYLLLNDDTTLEKTAVSRLLKYYDVPGNVAAICVGSTFDKIANSVSYGGHRLYNKSRVQNYNIYSENEFMECDMANANIMMVPKEIVEKIGILSAAYTHSIADYDYSLRAGKNGFKVVVVPGILGYCKDDHGNNWKTSKHTLRERINYMKSPKGLAYSEYLKFIQLHFPTHLPAAFLKLWMKTLFPVIWDKFKTNQN